MAAAKKAELAFAANRTLNVYLDGIAREANVWKVALGGPAEAGSEDDGNLASALVSAMGTTDPDKASKFI